MAESGDESDFASAESDQEDLQSQSETAAVHMESRSGVGDTAGKGGGGEVLTNPSTSQSADKEATKSESGEGSEKDLRTLPTESDACAKMETENISPDSSGDQGAAEEGMKSEEEKENKTASEKETDERVPSQTAVTEAAGSTQAGEGGPQQEAKEGGGGGGWTWGGFSNIWSSVSTMTETTAQALGEKVSSVIASVEDTLGLPSPHELAQAEEEGGQVDEETSRLAEEILEHDVPPEDQLPVQEEPHLHSIPDTQKLEQDQQAQQHSPATYDSFAGFFSGIASAVQTTGKGLVSGGLDALETLGKKTMEVLSEGDPGLRKKRSMLGSGEAPTLSQLLMEAKSESESAARMREGKGGGSQLVLSYSGLFDEYQGVVHLEALELLSKECESKIRSRLSNLSGDEMQSLKGELDKISQALKVEELPEVLDDDSSHLSEVLELFSNITLPLKVDKLIKVSNSWREKVGSTSSASAAEGKTGEEKAGGETAEEEKTSDSITGEKREGEKAGEEEAGEDRTGGERTEEEKTGGGKDKSTDAEESTKSNEEDEQRRVACQSLYESGLRSLVELTSVSIELFRKMAEVSLLPDVQKTGALEQAQKLNRLTVLVSSELDSLASVHAEAITALDVKDSNSSVTSLYLEASNSSSYVQDASQLLCPVLQLTALQQSLNEEPPANVHARS